MKKIQKYIIGIIGIVLFVTFIFYFSDIVSWILIAAFLSMLGSPLVALLRRVKVPSWLAALITIVGMSGIVVLACVNIAPLLSNQLEEFQSIDLETVSESLEMPIKHIDDFVRTNPIFNRPDFSTEDLVIAKLSNLLTLSSLGTLFNNIGGTLINLFLALFTIIFCTFFFLKDKDLFEKLLLLFIPGKYALKTKKVLYSITRLTERYLLGMVLEMILMMTIFTLGMYVIGFDFNLALLTGLIAGFLNIIPYIGPWIGAAIGIVMFVTANLGMDFSSEMIPTILLICAVFAIAKIIDDAVFQPFIYSKSVKAHPLEIFIVILVAGSMYGMLGMVLAIPGYTVLRVIAKEFLSEYEFIQKLTSRINIDESKNLQKHNTTMNGKNHNNQTLGHDADI